MDYTCKQTETYMILPLQILLWLRARRRSHVVWTYPRSRYWWDTVVPDFTPAQFVQNFRVPRESFENICDQVRHLMGRVNTKYRLAIPVRKRVAIALWKLATGSKYWTISHLFDVGLSTVFNCVEDFCDAVVNVLLPQHITSPDAAKLIEIATFF